MANGTIVKDGAGRQFIVFTNLTPNIVVCRRREGGHMKFVFHMADLRVVKPVKRI